MTDKKLFYLVCIDKKSQLGVFFDLILRFNIKNKELTPEELSPIKILITRHIRELDIWIKEPIPDCSLYSKVGDKHDWVLSKNYWKALLKKLETIK